MNKSHKVSLVVGVFLLGLCVTANATLNSIWGGLAYYDDDLDVSWLSDASINGADTWANQMNWASSLVIGGISGWRLPTADVDGNSVIVNCSGLGCSDNEMGHLFFDESISFNTPVPFNNVQIDYWSSTAASVNTAHGFAFGGGQQFVSPKALEMHALAVHNGDVSLVPEPSRWVLMLLGLMGLLGFSRFRSRQRRVCSSTY